MAVIGAISLPLLMFPIALVGNPRNSGESPAPRPSSRLNPIHFFQAQVVQSPTWVVMGQLVSDRMPKLDADVAKPDRSSPGEAPLPKATLNFGL